MNIVALYLGFLPRPLEPFSTLIVNGLIHKLHTYQKYLLVIGQPVQQSMEEVFQSIVNAPIDGLVYIHNDELTPRLVQSSLPVIAIADRAPGLVSVVVDDQMGAFMLAEHLALRGHRKILFRKDLYSHESAVQRFVAFSKAADYYGMELISTTAADHQGSISPEEEACLLAPRGQRPTAVVAWGDTYAYPTIKFCRQHQLSVPGDIAIAGFDGIPNPVEPAFRLTTIQAPWLKVAEKAADLLIQVIAGQKVPAETVLPVDLILGDTT